MSVDIKNMWLCTKCSYVGEIEEKWAGSGCITFLLLWMFIIPALIYSQWRWNNRKRSCPICGSHDVIPASSPMATKIINETYGEN